MPEDIWSEDPVRRARTLQERSAAAANDTTPSINALEAMAPESKPEGVLLKRVSDGWVILADDAEAELLIASGEYRPLLDDGNHTANGTLTAQADPEEIELARKDRIAALARLRSGEAIERAIQEELTRLADLSDAELGRLSAELAPAQRG